MYTQNQVENYATYFRTTPLNQMKEGNTYLQDNRSSRKMAGQIEKKNVNEYPVGLTFNQAGSVTISPSRRKISDLE